MLKQNILAAAVSLAFLAGAGLAKAQDDTSDDVFTASGNVTLTTDYKFRGISQSNSDPAIQGGLDGNWSSGFYVGLWAASVDFESRALLPGSCCDGSLELDYYAGWAGSIGDTGIDVDVGYAYYTYPADKNSDANFGELYASGTWNNLKLGVNYTTDYYLGSGETLYTFGEYSATLPWELALSLHGGYSFLTKNGGFLSSDKDGYYDYTVSLSKGIWGFDWTLAYTDADLDEDDLFGKDWGDSQVIFSVGRTF